MTIDLDITIRRTVYLDLQNINYKNKKIFKNKILKVQNGES